MATAEIAVRKADSRERLLAAATTVFCARGYFPVSVEEIAAEAGVSRMTFYRHFADKAALATALFHRNAAAALPDLVAIRERDYRDRAVVTGWINDLFAGDRAQRQLLRVFTQANVDEADFTRSAHGFIAAFMDGLGETIPAFALDRADPGQKRRWIEAWLLLYEILDQSNHAARESGVATDPITIDILADRFLAFVSA